MSVKLSQGSLCFTLSVWQLPGSKLATFVIESDPRCHLGGSIPLLRTRKLSFSSITCPRSAARPNYTGVSAQLSLMAAVDFCCGGRGSRAHNWGRGEGVLLVFLLPPWAPACRWSFWGCGSTGLGTKVFGDEDLNTSWCSLNLGSFMGGLGPLPQSPAHILPQASQPAHPAAAP